jgi:hypothetical protein
MLITAFDYRKRQWNSHQGFVNLVLHPSGLELRDCSYHVHHDGRRWVSPPSRPRLDAEGKRARDPATNKLLWIPVVQIRNGTDRQALQLAALAAVDALLAARGSR